MTDTDTHNIFEGTVPGNPGKEELQQLISVLDLTSLDGTDNSGSIEHLCRKALDFGEKGLPYPAAVCVYSPFIREAKKLLSGTNIRVATVTGFFPSGQAPLFLKTEEARYAVDQGADELDMVISRGKLMAGETSFVFDEIAAIKEASGNAHLKVILETGELKTPGLIQLAGEIAIAAGADFIKTSTGKIVPAATEEAALIMLRVIREHFGKTGKQVGFKPAGGITEPLQAWRYALLLQRIAGVEWFTPELFRIGASRLADHFLKEILI